MSSRTRFCFPLAALTALALTAAAPHADACSPQPPGVYGTIPAEGQTYPGNAAVILQGQDLSLTDASVTVDGQPATLKNASQTLFGGIGFFGVTVEPAPAAGQAVIITGTFCESVFNCPPTTLHYTAAAADTTPPPAIDLVNFNFYNYPDFKSGGGDCQSDSDLAWWLTLKSQIPDQAKDSAVLYVIEGFPEPTAGTAPSITASGFVTASWNPIVTIRSTVAAITSPGEGPPLAEAVCFRVTAYDSAGNAPSVSPEILCKPCNARADMLAGNGFPPAEPTWTAADIYPGGPCDPTTTATTGAGGGPQGTGAGGGGGDDVVVDGCGCRVAGESESASGLFGALALALGASLRLARRRRG